jgi:hypothetical protein
MAANDIFGSSATVEWGTPSAVISALAAAYPLTLDVCATPGRQVRPHYYAPPLDQIGRYKDPKVAGGWGVDAPFKLAALDLMLAQPPLAIDALAADWAADLRKLGGCAWMNPPFGTGIKHWVRKAYETAQAGGCVVTLLPSRTGTKWWHSYCEPVRKGSFPGELEFWKGRISFVTRAGGTLAPAPFDVAIVVFGKLI